MNRTLVDGEMGRFMGWVVGLQPWPRLFHNLRASRETELVESYTVQVVTSWLGNTPTVAMRHYLMTTDEHFEAAVRGDVKATASDAA